MKNNDEIEVQVDRFFELCENPENIFIEGDEQLLTFKERWAQNTDTIGRILRAHLFVEIYLVECLKRINPKLNLKEVRLTFNQKMRLITVDDENHKEVLSGIKILNRIRNRLSHNLDVYVTKEDRDNFLSIKIFKDMGEALYNRGYSEINYEELSHIEILEEFAQFSANILDTIESQSTLSKTLQLLNEEQHINNT